MKAVDLGPGRCFKNVAEVRNALTRMSRNSPKLYFVTAIVFDHVCIYSGDKLPASDHAANDWPLGYWHKGEHKQWSESRKVRAQNAGPQYDR